MKSGNYFFYFIPNGSYLIKHVKQVLFLLLVDKFKIYPAKLKKNPFNCCTKGQFSTNFENVELGKIANSASVFATVHRCKNLLHMQFIRLTPRNYISKTKLADPNQLYWHGALMKITPHPVQHSADGQRTQKLPVMLLGKMWLQCYMFNLTVVTHEYRANGICLCLVPASMAAHWYRLPSFNQRSIAN